MRENNNNHLGLDKSKLALQVSERRRRNGLSLRHAALEAGVSFNTLSRVEKGHVPDLLTFQRIADWLGIAANELLADPTIRAVSTPDVIAGHLKSDPALSEAAAEKIASIVQDLYASLAQKETGPAMHLRAAKTFRPEAARVLSDILEELQTALKNRWR